MFVCGVCVAEWVTALRTAAAGVSAWERPSQLCIRACHDMPDVSGPTAVDAAPVKDPPVLAPWAGATLGRGAMGANESLALYRLKAVRSPVSQRPTHDPLEYCARQAGRMSRGHSVKRMWRQMATVGVAR